MTRYADFHRRSLAEREQLRLRGVLPTVPGIPLDARPDGHPTTAEDIAKAALFLASEDSGWFTGEELLVGGGIRL